MVDVHSVETRSKNMRAIRNKNTKPEVKVRQILHRIGFRFRITPIDLPAKPDIYLPKYRAVILINGCFWHGHECDLFKVPATRTDFWLKKIHGTIIRDVNKIQQLCDSGLKVLVIWECMIKGKRALDEECIGRIMADWINGKPEQKLAVLESKEVKDVREVSGYFQCCSDKVLNSGGC